MLWGDKYRPRTLQGHGAQGGSDELKNLIAQDDCPHLLFYGSSGAGKKTLIMALLRERFGPSAEKVKVENKPWKVEFLFVYGIIEVDEEAGFRAETRGLRLGCCSCTVNVMYEQEHRMQQGQNTIFRLEAFVAKFMSIYKKFLINTFGL